MKNKKEKTRRSKVKHASLKKAYNSRIKQEYLDLDYLDQLSPEELDWMAKFMAEWNGAAFNNDGTDIDKTPEGRKASYDRNNSRNRDLYGILKNKANRFNNKKLLNYDNVLGDVERQLNHETNPMSMEDAYLDFIEDQELKVIFEEYDKAMRDFREE